MVGVEPTMKCAWRPIPSILMPAFWRGLMIFSTTAVDFADGLSIL
jgi:hypothetical protein